MPRQESWEILDLGSWIPAVSIETETFQLKRPAFEIFEESSEWRRGHCHCEADGFYCIAKIHYEADGFCFIVEKRWETVDLWGGGGGGGGGAPKIYIFIYIYGSPPN